MSLDIENDKDGVYPGDAAAIGQVRYSSRSDNIKV